MKLTSEEYKKRIDVLKENNLWVSFKTEKNQDKTTCTVFLSKQPIATGEVVRYKKDNPNQVIARREAWRKALNNIEDKHIKEVIGKNCTIRLS